MKQGTKNNLTRQGILRALRRNDELLQKHAVRRIALSVRMPPADRTERAISIFWSISSGQPTITISASRKTCSGCSAGK
jgi:hypothetical protein